MMMMIQFWWWSSDDPDLMMIQQWWSRLDDDLVMIQTWWIWLDNEDDLTMKTTWHWRWIEDEDNLKMKMTWRQIWLDDDPYDIEKKTCADKLCWENTFLVNRECWCICNLRMYSLVYIMYCTPMFIPGTIYNAIYSCHALMFKSGDSIK